MRAIEERRGYLGDWWVDEAGWCVELLFPERETFHGLTLEIALAWCLVFLMADELGSTGSRVEVGCHGSGGPTRQATSWRTPRRRR